MRRARAGVLAGAAWLAASACGGGTPDDPPTAESSWRIATEPSLVIGQPSGAFAGDLNSISDVAQLSDGRIAVADGAQRILIFGSDGSYVRTIGRRGQGPGEFTNLGSLHILDGDTMLAFDVRQRRASLFDPDGALVGTVELRRCCTLLGRGPGGTLYFAEQVLTGITPGRTAPGIERSSWDLLQLDALGERFSIRSRRPPASKCSSPVSNSSMSWERSSMTRTSRSDPKRSSWRAATGSR